MFDIKTSRYAFDNYALELEGICKAHVNDKNLVDLFPDDINLKNSSHDNQVHIYYEFINDELVVVGIGYGYNNKKDDIKIDISEEDKNFLLQIIRPLILS